MYQLLADKIDDEIQRGYRDLGLKLGWGDFQLPSRRYISEMVSDRV